MPVALWNDPQAPALVDDYIFSPAHLHQALVALDDPLPDMFGLLVRGDRQDGVCGAVGGSIATGGCSGSISMKPLERADFIGGNTIVDSSVVWKPRCHHPGNQPSGGDSPAR
jgi:hypothetical protein